MDTQEVLTVLDQDWLKTKGEPPAWIWSEHQKWAAERDKTGTRYACRYVDDITDALAKLLPPLTDAQKKNLHGQVYNCNRWEDQKRKEQEIETMLAQGWAQLSVEFVKDAVKLGKKVLVVRRGYNLLLQQVEKSEIMRPLITSDGRAVLFPGRNTRNGFDVARCLQSDNRWFLKLA